MGKMNWDQLLCSDRIRSKKSASSTADLRSEFEKDYHRIVVSASFRRLQDKTQVFPLDKSDFIRTRLTHSIEVSSIAKSLGQTVGNELSKKEVITPSQGQAMSDILLCAGLLHDIGNPPFGHFGETVIRDWFRKNASQIMFKGMALSNHLSEQQLFDLYNFEGNAQSLRVVTRLHHLVDDYGMNLNMGLLNTIIKYPVASNEIDKKAGDIRLKKMGYFYADKEIFEKIVSSTGAYNKRHPLVFLLEAADDIAYSTADLEDGFKKGILSYNKLLYLLENNQYREKYENDLVYSKCTYAIKRLKDLYARAMENKEPDPEMYALLNWSVTMQSILIKAACDSFINHHDEILEGSYTVDIFKDTDSEILIKLLKEIAYEHIFQINDIVKLEVAADSILGFLLNSFTDAVVNYDSDEKLTEKQDKLVRLISPNYLKIYKKSSEGKSDSEKLYLRMILITDLIAGMTDHYAKSLYQELNGIY